MKTEIPVYAKICIITVGIIACSYLLVAGELIIVPLLYSLLFAILLTPAVSFLTSLHLPRVLAIAVIMMVALFLLALFIYLLIVQSRSLTSTFPVFQEKFLILLKDGLDWIALKLHLSAEQMNSWLDNMRLQVMENSGTYIGRTFNTIGIILTTVVLIPVYIFMILYYQPLILEFIRKLFAKEYHASVVDIMSQVRGIVQSYLRGLLIEMILVATMNSISLLLIGVQYAVLLGIIGAILNLIPYLGGIIAVSLPMIVALVNQDALHMLMVFGAYVIVQFIDNNFIMPKIVASKVQVNALVAVIGVLIAGGLWGIPGMFLSIPLLAVTKIICDHVESLKPWGYLMGDTMPTMAIVNAFLKKGKARKG